VRSRFLLFFSRFFLSAFFMRKGFSMAMNMPVTRLFTNYRSTCVLAASAAVLLALPACGDGWTTQPYAQTPYGYERTAGYGVEYVRASMLPQRGPVLPEVRPVEPPAAALTPEPEFVEQDYSADLLQQGEVMFDERQRK